MAEPEREQNVLDVVQVAGGPQEVRGQTSLEAFGVALIVSATSPEIETAIHPVLPPGWKQCDPQRADVSFTVFNDHLGTYGLAKDGKGIARNVALELAVELLDSQIRLHIGEHSPAAIFVHAGVVAQDGRTLVMPGVSFAGKTTLVAELVRLGATYFSDEFALVDDEGRVHPYAKPLSIRRSGELTQTDHSIESLGGTAGDVALPMSLVALTRYRKGAGWNPRRLSAGEGVLALLANAVPAQSRPAESMRALKAAVANAVILDGDRGDAAEVAPLLLDELERAGT